MLNVSERIIQYVSTGHHTWFKSKVEMEIKCTELIILSDIQLTDASGGKDNGNISKMLYSLKNTMPIRGILPPVGFFPPFCCFSTLNHGHFGVFGSENFLHVKIKNILFKVKSMISKY